MRSVPFLLAVALAACSQSQGSAASLPMKFELKCGVPTLIGPQIPEGAMKGFDIVVDRTTNRFSLPWWDNRSWPIAKVGSQEIVFMKDHVDRGVDNNPEDRQITYDLHRGILHFLERYSGFIPVHREFSSKCGIVNNA